MKRFLMIAACGLALSGCVALGFSQQDSETTYTLATIAGDVFLQSGKATAEQAGQACLADNAAYKVLVNTRNVSDDVNYAPADNAHATLQKDGAAKGGTQCNTGGT